MKGAVIIVGCWGRGGVRTGYHSELLALGKGVIIGERNNHYRRGFHWGLVTVVGESCHWERSCSIMRGRVIISSRLRRYHHWSGNHWERLSLRGGGSLWVGVTFRGVQYLSFSGVVLSLGRRVTVLSREG